MPSLRPKTTQSVQYSFQGYDVKDVMDRIDSLPSRVLEPFQSHPRGIGTYCRRDPKNRILVWVSPGRDQDVINMVLFDGWRIVLCVPVDAWDTKLYTAQDVRRAAKDYIKWELLGAEFGSVMVQAEQPPMKRIRKHSTIEIPRKWSQIWDRKKTKSWMHIFTPGSTPD